MVLITLKLNVLKKNKRIFLTFAVFVLFCLIVTNLFIDQSISFLVIYKVFCLVLGSSDGMLTLLLNFVS